MNRPDWHDRAACAGMDPEIFWTDDLNGPEFFAAVATCRNCPVKDDCLKTALGHAEAEDTGIWGGTTSTHRQYLRRKMRRAA